MSRAAAPLPAEEFARLLDGAVGDANPPLSPDTRDTLAAYLSELDRWRRTINLTGALSAEALASHVLESLAGAHLVPHGSRVVDLGSGGGLPALPLAIARPDVAVTMVEPRAKRVAFLKHVVRQLRLERARVLQARVERLKTPEWDVATIRALASLGDLIGAAPFLQPSGLVLVWTTEPEAVAESLGPGFLLEAVVRLRGAERRVVAAYRRR
jgi:16S rRNA (guanine527-N7)-methyltransferase